MFCPRCGTKASPGDRFCAQCGTALPVADTAGGSGPATVNVADYAPGGTSPSGFVDGAGAAQTAGTAPPHQGAPAALPAALDYPKAGLGRRILAYLLDGFFATVPFTILLFFGLSSLIAALEAGSIGYRDLPSALGSTKAVLLLLGTVVSLLWALFYTFFRDGFGGGRSLGKRICGLMVVRLADNRPCTLGLSFVRNVIGVILVFVPARIPIIDWIAGFIEPVVAVFHRKGWRIGDMLAKTQVIDAREYCPAETTCLRSEGRSG